MKRKLSILTIILTLILPLFLSAYKVEAYNEEIGENNEIVSNSTEAENTSASETVTALADNDDNSTNGEEDTQSNEDWTDFSNAKFELKKEGFSEALIEISGVTPKEYSEYYLYITSNSNKPNVDGDASDERILLRYDKDSKTLKTIETNKVAQHVELNQDLYAAVLERNRLTDNILTYGNKLDRYREPMYTDAFTDNNVMSWNTDIISVYFTHNESNNRKMQIKVGKITDTSILQKIKSNDTSGFSSLMAFAKSNTGLCDKVLEANGARNYNLGYYAGDIYGEDVLSLNGIQDKEYYYLYVKTLDENGKYVSNEAVTLSQASVPKAGEWYMFFYGSESFKWTEWETNSGGGKTDPDDDSVAHETLPKTGYQYVAYSGIILVVAVSGFIAYKKYRKYNF